MAESEHPPYVNIYKAFPAGYEAVAALEQACAGAMDPVLFELVKLRASQINGCAYCIDMHWKDARAAGETEERLYMLNAWREARVYTPTRAGGPGAHRGGHADRRRARAAGRRGGGPRAPRRGRLRGPRLHDRHDQHVEPAGDHVARRARALPGEGPRHHELTTLRHSAPPGCRGEWGDGNCRARARRRRRRLRRAVDRPHRGRVATRST